MSLGVTFQSSWMYGAMYLKLNSRGIARLPRHAERGRLEQADVAVVAEQEVGHGVAGEADVEVVRAAEESRGQIALQPPGR